MRAIFKGALVALVLTGGSLAASLPTMAADVRVDVVPGGIAFGYNDGYWDRTHNWHAWRNQEEAAKFRAENREHFYERKHDAERDGGWRDSERYWEHR